MRRKGQAELLVVVGIVAAASIVIFFSLQRATIPGPQLPPGVSDMKNLLKSEIEQNLYSGAYSALETMGLQGGYLETPEPSLSFRGYKVPHWQYANYSLIPDKIYVASQLETGVRDYATTISMTEFQGKRVELGNVENVEATISSDKVVVKVWMPAKVDVYDLEQPFQIELPVKLGRMYDFASQLVSENIKNRHFELYTTTSILSYQSRDDGVPRVPSIGMLRGCGKVMFKTWWDVRPEMELLLRGMLSNIYTAGKIPPNITSRSAFPANVLPLYTSMNVSFHLGEALDYNNFQMSPSPVEAMTEMLPMIPLCTSRPYRVNYWLFYPTIVELTDGGYRFRFAINTYTFDYKAGDWGDIKVSLGAWQDQLEWCVQARCGAEITVKDANGPLRNADVTFAGCSLGKTDENGAVVATVPCSVGVLNIYKGGHAAYSEVTSHNDLLNKSIHLYNMPFLKMHFLNVEFYNDSDTYKVGNVTRNNKDLYIMISREGKTYTLATNTSFMVTEVIPGGTSNVSITAMSNENFFGGAVANYTFPETDSTLWVYVPMGREGVKPDESNTNSTTFAMHALTYLLKRCGTEPINSTEVNATKLMQCVVS